MIRVHTVSLLSITPHHKQTLTFKTTDLRQSISVVPIMVYYCNHVSYISYWRCFVIFLTCPYSIFLDTTAGDALWFSCPVHIAIFLDTATGSYCCHCIG